MAAGTGECLYLFVLHFGRMYLRPDGSSINSLAKGWLWSVRIERALQRTLVLYMVERSLWVPMPKAGAHILLLCWTLILPFPPQISARYSSHSNGPTGIKNTLPRAVDREWCAIIFQYKSFLSPSNSHCKMIKKKLPWTNASHVQNICLI